MFSLMFSSSGGQDNTEILQAAGRGWKCVKSVSPLRADQGVCLARGCRVVSVLVADQEWVTSQRQSFQGGLLSCSPWFLKQQDCTVLVCLSSPITQSH